MIEFIVISLSVILLVDYITSGKNLSRPSISYIGGFLLCAIVAYNWRVEWGLHKLSYGTVYFFVGGALLFFFVELLFFRKFPLKLGKIDVKLDSFVPIKINKLVFFLLFQIIINYLVSRFKMSYAGTDNLSDAIWLVRADSFINGIDVKMPLYISLPNAFRRAAGYIWAILLPFYLNKSSKYNIQKLLLLFNFILCLYGEFLSGGRMGFVFYLIPLLLGYYILYQYSQGWEGGFLNKKKMAILVVSFFVFVTFFAQLGQLMGRGESSKTASMVFSIYCGAQIKNMDDYIQLKHAQKQEGEYFGQYTFKRIYGKYLDKFIGIRHHSVDLEFNRYGSYPLGNVYSTYQDYYIDLKYYGLIFAGLMSLLMSLCYRNALTSHFWYDGRLSVGLLFYAYISHMPLMCFFANQFWGKFTINNEFFNLISWYLLILYLQGHKADYKKQLEKSGNYIL